MPIDVQKELGAFATRTEKSNSDDKKKSDWFEPRVGMYSIRIMEDGMDYTQSTKYGDKEKHRFTILVEDKELNWGVTKAQKKTSLWGQLVLLAREWGTLEGKDITLIVKQEVDGNMRRRDFTITEAINILKRENENAAQ